MVEAMDSLKIEKLLLRYSRALEEGDFASIEQVLEQAASDPHLELALLELNRAYLSEEASGAQTASQPAARTARLWKQAGRGLQRLRAWMRNASPGLKTALAGGVVVVIILGGLYFYEQARQVFSHVIAYGPPSSQLDVRGRQSVYPAATEVVVVEGFAPTAYPAPGSYAGGGGGAAVVDRLILRSGSLSVVAADTRQARQQVQSLAAEMAPEGAYVVSSSESSSQSAEMPVIYMSLRVPAGRFDESMARLAALGERVNQRSEDAADVTEEYVDLAARLESLEAARQRLLGILAEATNAADLLQIESLLTQREAEIEALKGRLQYLQGAARLSAIQLELLPSILSQPLPSSGWDPQETVRIAVDQLLKNLRRLGDWLIVFGIVRLPGLVVIGLMLFGLWRWLRRRSPPSPPAPLPGGER